MTRIIATNSAPSRTNGGVEEGEDQEQHGMHGVARRHHHDGAGDQDGAEDVEGDGFDHVASCRTMRRQVRKIPRPKGAIE
jgi:hypothetical protein